MRSYEANRPVPPPDAASGAARRRHTRYGRRDRPGQRAVPVLFRPVLCLLVSRVLSVLLPVCSSLLRSAGCRCRYRDRSGAGRVELGWGLGDGRGAGVMAGVAVGAAAAGAMPACAAAVGMGAVGMGAVGAAAAGMGAVGMAAAVDGGAAAGIADWRCRIRRHCQPTDEPPRGVGIVPRKFATAQERSTAAWKGVAAVRRVYAPASRFWPAAC